MEIISIPVEQFKELINSVNEIRATLSKGNNNSGEQLLNNREFMKLMNISKKTSQTWRNEGKISFSQVGGKVYYRMSDVKHLLDENLKPAFSPKRKNH